MVEKKTIAILTASLGVGTAQTFILREYVDKVYGKIPGLEGLGGFGTYSAVVGLAAGGIATTVGLVSVLTKKITTNENIQMGLIGYGIPALSGAILSGLFPVTPPAPGAGAQLNKAANTQMQIKLKSAGNVRGQVGGRNVAARAGGSQPASQTGAIPLRT